MPADWHPTAFFHWGDEERRAIDRVIASDRFTAGFEVQCFEHELAAYHGRKHAVVCNSGSSANLLIVEALCHRSQSPVRPGDTAVVPALAWATTYAPLVQRGLDLQLADCDDTWNAPPAYSGRIVPRDPTPRVIVAASILGNPGYLEGWEKMARDLGAYLVEDNCESIGARTQTGRLTGTFGIASSLSFYWSHQLGAIEGGAVLTDDDEVADLCRMLMDHGLTRSLPAPAGAPARPFEYAYDFRVFGYNLRPLEIHAAVGRAQLKKLDAMNAERLGNLAYFETCVEGLPVDLPTVFPGSRPAPFGLAFALRDRSKRAELVETLQEAGIDARPPTGGSFTRHAYGIPWRVQDTPGADMVHDTGMFLGNAPYPVREAIDRIADVMRKVLV